MVILSDDDDMVVGDTEIQQWGGELTKPYPEGLELKVNKLVIPSDDRLSLCDRGQKPSCSAPDHRD